MGLGDDALRLADLRSFNSAAGRSGPLDLAGGSAAWLASAAVGWGLGGAAAAMSLCICASLAIAVAGFAAAALLASARAAAITAEQLDADPSGPRAEGSLGSPLLRMRLPAPDGSRTSPADWVPRALYPPPLLPARKRRPGAIRATRASAGAGSLLAGAFALLVVERHLAATKEADLPEAPALLHSRACRSSPRRCAGWAAC